MRKETRFYIMSKMREQKYSLQEIGETFNMTRQAVSDFLKKNQGITERLTKLLQDIKVKERSEN